MTNTHYVGSPAELVMNSDSHGVITSRVPSNTEKESRQLEKELPRGEEKVAECREAKLGT